MEEAKGSSAPVSGGLAAEVDHSWALVSMPGPRPKLPVESRGYAVTLHQMHQTRD
jgi:hypothetical protein